MSGHETIEKFNANIDIFYRYFKGKEDIRKFPTQGVTQSCIPRYCQCHASHGVFLLGYWGKVSKKP